MKRNLVITLCFLMLSVLTFNSTTAIGNKVDATQSATSTSSNTVELRDVITIVDKYLSQNTVKKEKITTMQEFKLKLLAQKYLDKEFNAEVFSVLDELENELGNGEFQYQGKIFKKSSIYFFRAEKLYYSNNKNKVFKQVADYVLTKCENKKEQWEILNQLFSSSDSKEMNPATIKNFDDALKLYFVLSEYFYNSNKKSLSEFSLAGGTRYYYSMSAAEIILYPFADIANYLGNKLTNAQKELILNQTLKYVELEGNIFDIAVKIYYYLSK